MIVISFIILICFNIFFTMVLVDIDVNTIVILLIIFGLYLFYFCFLSKKPERALYGFLIIALFFPQSGNDFGLFSIEELRGASMATMLLGVAVLAITFNLPRTTRHPRNYPRKMQQILVALWLAVLTAFCLTTFRQFLGGFGTVPVHPEELLWVGPLIYGIIFLYGCLEFIKDYHQIDKIFYIILTASYGLVLEVILFVYLVLPLPLSSRAIHESGRFQGWAWADFTLIPLIIYCSMGFLLYKAGTKRRFILLFLIPPLFVPLLATYQRTTIVSALIVIICYLLLNVRKFAVPIVIGICSMALVIFSLNFEDITPVSGEALKGLFIGEVRPDYFDTVGSSFISRLGAQVRGLEVFLYSFPIGVGPWNSVSEHMGSPSIPMIFRLPDESEAHYFQSEIASGQHVTAAHNFFVNTICEYGVMGIIVIYLFVAACLNNYKRWKSESNNSNFYAHEQKAMAFSILLAITFHISLYNCTIYWLSFFLFYLTFPFSEVVRSPLSINK